MMNRAVFPVSYRNCFPAVESLKDYVAPEGKRSLPLQSPTGKPQAVRISQRFAFSGKTGPSLDGHTSGEDAEGLL